MTHCEFTGIDGGWRCETCGRVVKLASKKPPIATCRDGVQQATPPLGLGDRVAAALNAVGVTKDRVQAVASKVGIKDCGCRKRQQTLNEIGKRLGIG